MSYPLALVIVVPEVFNRSNGVVVFFGDSGGGLNAGVHCCLFDDYSLISFEDSRIQRMVE